jgi:hypothetical protein
MSCETISPDFKQNIQCQTPKRVRVTIDLSSDSDEEQVLNQERLPEEDCDDFRKCGVTDMSDHHDAEESCVVIQDSAVKRSHVSLIETVNTEENECYVVGQTGLNALADFPHAREDCAVLPIGRSIPRYHCTNCYCFVCDVGVKDCEHWEFHSMARYRDSGWRKERSRKRSMGKSYIPAEIMLPKSLTMNFLPRNMENLEHEKSHKHSDSPVFTSLATYSSPKPTMLPLQSPWKNAETRLIGIVMSTEERKLYNDAKLLHRFSYDPSILNHGVEATYLEANVMGPISLFELTREWSETKIQNSSKVQALVMDIRKARDVMESIRAVVVFCHNTKWRMAIVGALRDADFDCQVIDSSHVSHSNPEFVKAKADEIWVMSPFDQLSRTPMNCARVYFMESYVNMAWECIALHRIANRTSKLQVRKLIWMETTEENVINFQNALISGEAHFCSNLQAIDSSGTSILLKGIRKINESV